jgi:hypothetical protein
VARCSGQALGRGCRSRPGDQPCAGLVHLVWFRPGRCRRGRHRAPTGVRPPRDPPCRHRARRRATAVPVWMHHQGHSASTSLLTLLDCHPKRGRAAMDDPGVIGAMSGVAIHDGSSPTATTTRPRPLQRAPLERTQGGGHRPGPGIGQRSGQPPRRGEARRPSWPGIGAEPPRCRNPALDTGPLRTAGGQGARGQPGSRGRQAVGTQGEGLPPPRPPRRTTGRRVAMHHRLQRPFSTTTRPSGPSGW